MILLKSVCLKGDLIRLKEIFTLKEEIKTQNFSLMNQKCEIEKVSFFLWSIKKEDQNRITSFIGWLKNDFERMIDLRGEEMIEKSTINTLTF